MRIVFLAPAVPWAALLRSGADSLSGPQAAALREALAALLRISGDCFTLAAVNDNLTGCGLNAVASEGELPGTVEVRFPEVPGVPDGFPAMRRIIEDILPCHLEIQYAFWYATWAELEALGPTWAELAKMVR